MSADAMTAQPPRMAVIACAVFELEIQHFADRLDHLVDIRLLEQGLHNEPDRLRSQLQRAIDAIEVEHLPDAIVLGYGLCSRGIEGVHSHRASLVVTRAHDCITLLLGSKERYAKYVADHPGTYWYSPGWIDHHTPPGKERYDMLYRDYVEKYGEDNAAYLMEQEQHWFDTYNRATYVELSIGKTDNYKQYTRDCADWLKWKYDEVQGDPALIQALLNGDWDDERFLVLRPGQTMRVTADERIIEAVPVDTDATDTNESE